MNRNTRRVLATAIAIAAFATGFLLRTALYIDSTPHLPTATTQLNLRVSGPLVRVKADQPKLVIRQPRERVQINLTAEPASRDVHPQLVLIHSFNTDKGAVLPALEWYDTGWRSLGTPVIHAQTVAELVPGLYEIREADGQQGCYGGFEVVSANKLNPVFPADAQTGNPQALGDSPCDYLRNIAAR